MVQESFASQASRSAEEAKRSLGRPRLKNALADHLDLTTWTRDFVQEIGTSCELDAAFRQGPIT